MRFLKMFLFIIVVTILCSGLYLGHQLIPDDATLARGKNYNSTDMEELEDRTVNPFKGDDPLHILVMGIDKTATKSLSEEKNPSRSDTIMLFTIDPVRKRAQLLSLPRDTYITIPTTGERTKLGHAYAYGGEELAMKTVEEFLDVEIDYYGIVDYKAVERVVDAIDGVEVDMPQDYRYRDPSTVPPLEINFKKGKQTLDGEEAVKYLRIRKIYKDQDIGRIQAQQHFLMTIFEELKSPATFFKLPELIDIVIDHVHTDLNYGQIAYLAKFGLELDREDIILDTLVGEDTRIDEIAYYIVDQESAQEQLRRFEQGKGSYFEEVEQNDKRNKRKIELNNNLDNENFQDEFENNKELLAN